MSGSIPAWKQAIYDRKKQQQKEEELKQAEKEAYLASLPPWKRALFLKKEKGAGDAGAGTQQGTAKATGKPTAKQQQSTTTPSVATQNKSPTTASRSTVAGTVPSWKRKESPSSINDSATRQQQPNASPPVNTNNNNSDKSPAWNRKFASTVASSKDTTQKQTIPPAVNGTDNMPLWKRNLLQRQAATAGGGGEKQQPVNTKVIDTPQTSVAIGSPRIFGKLTNTGAIPRASNITDTVSSSAVSNATTTTTTTTSSSSPSESRPRAKSIDDYDDKRLASLPPWKRDLILRKRAAAAKDKGKQGSERTSEVPESPRIVKVTRRESMEKDKGWKKTIRKNSEDSQDSCRSPTVRRRISDDKISMWEKKAALDQSKLVKRTSLEIDSAKLESSDPQLEQQKTPAQQEISPAANQNAIDNTTLVNGPEKEETNESAPPILRGKDPWAHLSEDDPQFKALPAWKQALILRRRGDIRRRSNPDIHIDKEENTAEDEPDFDEVPAWKREALLKRPAENVVEDEAEPVFDDPDMPEWKKEKLRKSFQDKKKGGGHSTSLPLLVSKKGISSYQSDTSIPEWKKEAMKERQSVKGRDDDIPEWKKEAMKEKQSVKYRDNDIPEWKKEAMKERQPLKQTNSDVPEWKKEAMKEKKSIEKEDNSAPLLTSIRPLSPDKGTPSSSLQLVKPQPVDETDYHSRNHIDSTSDDDDVPCTNIDDLSDSDESVGGSGSYDVNPPDSSLAHTESVSSGYSSDNNTHGMGQKKVSKSILIIRKVSNPHPKRHRRVSWNEDQMKTEHVYPKYDYTDYDELNEELEVESTDSRSVFSHPIHPSLGGNRTSKNSDDLSNYRPNIVSSYTVTVSSTRVEPTKKEEPKTEPTAMPTEDPEFNMSNLSDDLAAMLF